MSTLNVTNIKAADGTTGLSIANSTGIVSFGNAVSGNTPCFSATFSSPLNTQSNNVAVKVSKFISPLTYEKRYLFSERSYKIDNYDSNDPSLKFYEHHSIRGWTTKKNL